MVLIIALFALAYQVVSLINDSNSYLRNIQKEFSLLKNEEKSRIESLEKDLQIVKKRMTGLEQKIEGSSAKTSKKQARPAEQTPANAKER